MTFPCSQLPDERGAETATVRNNLSLMMLFKNKSEQMRKEIAEELRSHVTKKTLLVFIFHETISFFQLEISLGVVTELVSREPSMTVHLSTVDAGISEVLRALVFWRRDFQSFGY